MAKRRRNKKDKKPGFFPKFLIVLAGFALVVVGLVYVKKYMPTKERVSLDECFPLPTEDGIVTIVDGSYLPVESGSAPNMIVNEKNAYIKASFLKSELDDGYVFDGSSSTMRYTTDKHIYSVVYEKTTYSIDGRQSDAGIPIVIEMHDADYVALAFVQKLTDIRCSIHGSGKSSDPRRAVIFSAGYKCDKAKFSRDTSVRRAGGPKSPIMTDAHGDEAVYIIKDYDHWSSVITKSGVLGYVRSNVFDDRSEKRFKASLPAREYKHNLAGRQIRLGWHQVTNTAANAGLESYIQGTDINVISPTWFYLNDNNGGIANLSSAAYVKTAHANGIKVWGLISNFEQSGIDTKSVLNTTVRRDRLIKNIIWAARVCGMDGINLDFEQIPSDAADGYIELIRELSLYCKKYGLVLSVDNYVPENYNDYYNRGEQGRYADYCVIMGYDEYYAGSETPGPTASYPYVEKGVERMLNEVEAEQIILGMPFYSRLWITEGGSMSSKALSMNQMSTYISQHNLTEQWLSDMQLNYVEGTVGGANVQMWVENAQSLSKKLALMRSKQLAGCAFWKLGFEPASIWTVVKDYEN